MNYLPALYAFIVGLIVITLISSCGAILSRKLSFKYAYFGVISGILYCVLGFLISQKIDLTTALITNGLLGLIDSTLGFFLSIRFQANNGYSKEQSLKMINLKTSIGMVFFTIILSLVGYGLASLR